MTTVSTLSLSAIASSSAQNVRHLIFGSTPCISTMSRSDARRAAVRDVHRRPHQLAGHPVDLPDHRPIDLVVVVGLVVDLDDRLGFPDRVEVLQRVAGRVARVVPALERRHDDRVVEFGQVGGLAAGRIRRGHYASVRLARRSASPMADAQFGRPTTLFDVTARERSRLRHRPARRLVAAGIGRRRRDGHAAAGSRSHARRLQPASRAATRSSTRPVPTSSSRSTATTSRRAPTRSRPTRSAAT